MVTKAAILIFLKLFKKFNQIYLKKLYLTVLSEDERYRIFFVTKNRFSQNFNFFQHNKNKSLKPLRRFSQLFTQHNGDLLRTIFLNH